MDEKDKCSVPLDERPDVQLLPTPPLDAISNTTEPPLITTITAADADGDDYRSSPTRSRPNMIGPYGTSNRSLVSDISSDRGNLVVSEDRLVLKPPPTQISYSSSPSNNSPSGLTKKTKEKRLSGNTGYTSSTTIATTTSLQ